MPGDRFYGKVEVEVICGIIVCVVVCLRCIYCYVFFYYFAIVVIVYENVPPLLVERVGGECCDKFVGFGCFDVVVEASADVFYVFLPHGDSV